MSNGGSDFEIIDPGRRPDHREDEVQGGAGSSPVLILLGLLAVAGLVWVLTRSPAQTEPGPDQAVIEEGVGDTPATTLIVPTTPPLTTPTTLIPGVAILGQPTGLWLFYGGDDPIQRLDLDDGAVSVFGLRAHPLLATPQELVVANASSGAIGWVGLDNPGEQAEGWKEGRLALASDVGLAWFLENSLWTQMDLDGNRIVEMRPAVAGAPVPPGQDGRPSLIIPGPEVVSTPTGIYLYNPGGYNRGRTTGQVLLYDATRVLVQDCAVDLDDCTPVWLDRTTWGQLHLPTPSGTVAYAEVLGDGIWLHTVGTNGEHQLLLLEPSADLELEDSFRSEVPIASLSVSPNGRWLAVKRPEANVIDLIDLTTGLVQERFDGFRTTDGGTLLFVQKPPLESPLDAPSDTLSE